MKFNALRNATAFALSFSVLAACGGSSDNSENTSPAVPIIGDGSETVWVADEFKAKEDFANQCDVVRTGSDPYTGETYLDQAGSLDFEKMWVRSWNHESYLWYNEVEDVDPADFETPQAYFDVLKTTEKTESGSDKDNFHFYQDTAEYRERTQGGASSGYGIRWVFGSTTPPRELTVVQTEPNSPADNAGFNRGDKILEVDGVDLINGDDVDTLNAGLFPNSDGETHTIKIKDVFGVEKTLTVTSSQFVIAPVKATNLFEHNGNQVGYLQFDTFSIADAQDTLINTFTQFRNANISELVVDLRYNGGGLLALSAQLAYMIAGDNNTNDRTFYTLKYNGKWDTDTPIPFYDQKINWDNSTFTGETLPTVALNKLYVLSSDATCSASEALINGLRGVDLEVILIGGRTCGKPYGFVPTDNCSTTYFTIQFSGDNDKGFGEYADGFEPSQSPSFQTQVQGCSVSDDLTRPMGDVSEGMLSAALYHMETGDCPSISKQQAIGSEMATHTLNFGPAIKGPENRLDQMLENNLIITPIAPVKQ